MSLSLGLPYLGALGSPELAVGGLRAFTGLEIGVDLLDMLFVLLVGAFSAGGPLDD